MKKSLAALLASIALVAALPATASAHEGEREGGWQEREGGWQGRVEYNQFRDEFRHMYAGVRHGVRDGSYSQREARQFLWAITSLQRRLDAYWNNDGFLNRGERRDMRRRIARLHDDMHEAHANGHAERDYGYYGEREGYRDSYRGDDRNGYRDRDDDRRR